MTGEQYGEWGAKHQALFWMKSEDDLELMQLWRPLLIGYDLAECIEASQWIAANHVSLFRTKHVALIRGRIRARRSERRAEEFRRSLAADDPTGPSVCAACNNTGCVEVPHVRCVVDDEWADTGSGKATMVVWCRCRKGSDKDAGMADYSIEHPSISRGMTLAEYENLYPDWREMLAAREAERRHERQAHEAATLADRKLGRLSPQKVVEVIGKMPT